MRKKIGLTFALKIRKEHRNKETAKLITTKYNELSVRERTETPKIMNLPSNVSYLLVDRKHSVPWCYCYERDTLPVAYPVISVDTFLNVKSKEDLKDIIVKETGKLVFSIEGLSYPVYLNLEKNKLVVGCQTIPKEGLLQIKDFLKYLED